MLNGNKNERSLMLQFQAKKPGCWGVEAINEWADGYLWSSCESGNCDDLSFCYLVDDVFVVGIRYRW
jgi:hypothetical protein